MLLLMLTCLPCTTLSAQCLLRAMEILIAKTPSVLLPMGCVQGKHKARIQKN